MTFSFKKFVEFVDGSEIDDQQINELFGTFSNASKIEKLKAEREALKKKQIGSDSARSAAWKSAKDKTEAETPDAEDEPKHSGAKNDQRLKDKVWTKAKQRVETKPPQFSEE